MILALKGWMLRHWTALSLAGIVLASSCFLLRRDPAPRALAATTDPERSTTTPPAEPPPAVRVQHAFVTPQVVVESAEVQPVGSDLKTPLRTVRKPEIRRASVSGAPNASSPRLLARATRALIGDGRHKPQPFPRAN